MHESSLNLVPVKMYVTFIKISATGKECNQQAHRYQQ